jgi:hypothetical protein
MLYKCSQSCINTNGFLSRFFQISRSLRQGCPVAALLYILQAEPMAQAIRNSAKIKGIKIPVVEKILEVKISMFADDTVLYHRTEQSIEEGFKIVNTYCKASGAKLNMHKTKGLFIGSWKQKEPAYKLIKWVNNFKGLGTVFGYSIDYEQLWMQKNFKFKKKILSWKHRDLTLVGKKLLIDSYIMSSISYMADIYPFCIPKKFLVETNNLIKTFLWNGNTWKIAQKSLSLKHPHGGINLQDLDSLILAKQAKWLVRIHFSKLDNWNAYGKSILSSFDQTYDIEDFPMKCSNLEGLDLDLPPFYKTCLSAWCKLSAKKLIIDKNTILEQHLFGNIHISSRKRSFFLSHLVKTQNK